MQQSLYLFALPKTFRKIFMPFGVTLLLISVVACTSTHPRKKSSASKPEQVAYNKDYRSTDWFLALTSYFTSETITTPSSQAHRYSILTLIANKCGQAASSPWFAAQLNTQQDALTGLNQPQSIDFSNQHINNDCAAIIATLASTRYQHPFHLDLSHNRIDNQGVSTLQEILSTDQAKSLGDIEVILQDNPLITHVSKYFVTESSAHLSWLHWHFDHDTGNQSQDALMRALLKDAQKKHFDSQKTILTTQSTFAAGTRGIKSLIAFAGGYQQLKELNLTAPNQEGLLDNDACLAFSPILKQSPHLESLTISNHAIGDEGAMQILEAAQWVPIHLKLLNLTGTDITNKTLDNLLNTLPHHKRIMLVLRLNPQLTQEAILELSNSRPEWVIVH